ncbi:MAG TPA: hypothetical protein VJ111_02535 [Chitinophagaceae bacterium]|nr:hypothetical protein [Chitinophagaceae bacterium]
MSFSALGKGVYPLRIKNGFKIEGAWVLQEKNKFIWILSYDGTEVFEAGIQGFGCIVIPYNYMICLHHHIRL